MGSPSPSVPIPELLRLLESPEEMVRYRARIELRSRESEAVLASADEWIGQLDSDDVGDAQDTAGVHTRDYQRKIDRSIADDGHSNASNRLVLI